MAPIDVGYLHKAVLSNDPETAHEAIKRFLGEIDLLEQSQTPEVVEILASFFYIDLGDKPQYVKVVEDAVAAIAAIGEPAIPILMTLMCDSDLKATLMHGRTLGRIGPPAYGAIKDLYYRAQTSHQRVLALFALAKMHEAALMEIFPDLVVALDDSDREVRDTAVRTIGKVVNKFKPGQLPHDLVSHAFERLLFRLNDSSPVIRAKVIRTIGKLAKNKYLDDEQLDLARDSVKTFLGLNGKWKDPFYIVRREAEEALQYLQEKE